MELLEHGQGRRIRLDRRTFQGLRASMAIEHECTPMVSLCLLHAACWPLIASTPSELDGSVSYCIHTDWKILVTRKKRTQFRRQERVIA